MKKIIKKYIPIKIKKILLKILGRKYYFQEEKKSYGKLNKDKIFYVVRRTPPGAGLFSNYTVSLLHILEAENRNLIPVIDYESYYSDYKEEEMINGSNNAWEYYFRQPSSYKLDEVYRSQNVILSGELPKNSSNIWCADFLKNIKEIEKLHKISKKVDFNSSVKNYLEKKYEEIIPKNKKILGAAIRGREYTEQKPKNHPIQPDLREFIKLIQEKYREWQCDYIFITTEEEKTLEKLKEVFKEKLLYVPRERFKEYNGGNLREQRFERKNDKYLTGLEYTTEIYILSKCNSIIAAPASGITAAFIFNGNKYENKYIFDLGYYK